MINQVKTFIIQKYSRLGVLDKYILKQVIEIFALGVVIFTSIVFASDTFITLIKQISNYGLPFNIAFTMILLNLPQIFVMTIPMATLFATVMTLNRLSLNSEITVMRACGIGINRIARPIFIFAALMTLLGFFINETIVPAMSLQTKHLALYSLQNKNVPEGKVNFTLKEIKEGNNLKRLFFIERCKNKTLNNITLLDLSRKDVVQLMQAKMGKTSSLGWIFQDGVIYTISTTEKIFNTSTFEKSTINFGLDLDDRLSQDNADQYNFFKLITHLKTANFDTQKMRIKFQIDLHDKLAFPVTTIVLVLVGVPLAVTPPRVRYNRGFLFSILVIFLYYVVRAFSIAVGEAGSISPFVAAWLPIFVITLLGIFLYYKKVYTIN